MEGSQHRASETISNEFRSRSHPLDRSAGCFAGHSKRPSGLGRRSHREQLGIDLLTTTCIADMQKTPREAIGVGAGNLIRMKLALRRSLPVVPTFLSSEGITFQI